MTFFLGVDPGARGAIAGIDSESREECLVKDLGLLSNVDDYRFLVNSITSGIQRPIYVVLERFIPYMGTGKNSAMSSFTMGVNYGMLLSALQTLFVFIMQVPASVWMRKLFEGRKNEKKSLSLEMAKRLYPDVKYTTLRGRVLDGRADAVLLAYYGKMVFEKEGAARWEKKKM